jgi:hypothetical protein
MKRLLLSALSGALFLGFSASAAQAYVRVGNCDDVPHTVIAEIAGERSEIHLAPGQHYQTFGWPVRFELAGQSPRGYVTSRHSARKLDEYCIWNGELRFQRRRTAIFR